MGLDRWGCNSYHTVILGLSMTFLVEGVLSKKAPMTGGGRQPVEGLWRFLIAFF